MRMAAEGRVWPGSPGDWLVPLSQLPQCDESGARCGGGQGRREVGTLGLWYLCFLPLVHQANCVQRGMEGLGTP